MAFAFAVPGDPSSALVGMRCGQCKIVKPVSTDPEQSAFPPSCAVFRRGSCRQCNQAKSRERYNCPLNRKLESARIRYKTFGSLKVADIEELYSRERVDWTDADQLKRTYVAKANDSLPFGVDNVTLKWRQARGGVDFPVSRLGTEGNYTVHVV